MIQALIMAVVLIVVTALQYASYRTHVPPIPTMPHVGNAALDLLQKHASSFRSDLNIIELGSGWGGITKKLQHLWPASHIDAYELSMLPFLFSVLRTWRFKKITIFKKDIFKVDISTADIVFCYLSPWHMERLKPMFENDLKTGALVLSVAFPITDRMAIDQITIEKPVKIPVYLYRW